MSMGKVAVIMGSDSDLPVMRTAAETLAELHVATETTIVSAHRTPLRMVDYARDAHSRGIEVIVAGAGGAAHLPGMIAALTPLPVIGVPIRGSSLEGLDSLLSIVQMPRGVPVATVAVNNAKNAGLLAARILGVKYPEVRERVVEYASRAHDEVLEKAARLERLGPAAYLDRPDA
jgi:5-(carboxyamino)imidazole ribonucleotide mutase